VVALLVRSGPWQLAAENRAGRTPLDLAGYSGRPEEITALLRPPAAEKGEEEEEQEQEEQHEQEQEEEQQQPPRAAAELLEFPRRPAGATLEEIRVAISAMDGCGWLPIHRGSGWCASWWTRAGRSSCGPRTSTADCRSTALRGAARARR
jgi:hypothetical protein